MITTITKKQQNREWNHDGVRTVRRTHTLKKDVKTNVVLNVCNSTKYDINVGSRRKKCCSQRSIVLNDLNYIVIVLVKCFARFIEIEFQFDICRLFTNLWSFCRLRNTPLLFVWTHLSRTIRFEKYYPELKFIQQINRTRDSSSKFNRSLIVPNSPNWKWIWNSDRGSDKCRISSEILPLTLLDFDAWKGTRIFLGFELYFGHFVSHFC